MLYAEIDDNDEVRLSSGCCLGARGRECGASAVCVMRDCDVIDCSMIAQHSAARRAIIYLSICNSQKKRHFISIRSPPEGKRTRTGMHVWHGRCAG